MNEEEKEDIELDIEAKYVDKTEKEFLSRVTYAECLYILTPRNKYCDKIRELSVLKLCEIIDKLQKENEELKKDYENLNNSVVVKNHCIKNSIPVQKVKDKIEEILNNGEYRIIFEGDAEFPDEATCIDAQKYIKLEKLQELLEGRK